MYRFGDCLVDPRRFELRRGGDRVHLEPQVFTLLVHLIEHRDRVVAKTELLDAVWGDRFVSDSALTSRVKSLRRAVGDDGNSQRVVATVHGVGYRFVAEVAEPGGDGPVDRTQHIRYCMSSGGVRVAFATSGAGPPLVKAANWLTHLDLEWASPIWSHWLDGLSRRHRLVRYDERGCGLSDWEVADLGFDAWVDDLEAVVDAAGLDRFPLLGVSQGGAVAIAYAVRHPERVSRLVLVGAYCRGRLARARTPEEREEAELDLQLGRIGWRRDDPTFRQVFASQFLPDGTRETWDAFNDLQRATTSTANVVRFLDAFARIDVSALAPRVACPTLILHSRGDLRVPCSQAQELAALVPGGELRFLPSRNHVLTADEPAWPVFLAEVERFLGTGPA
ncbi:lysine decarboxylase transcriptional regulator CadC [Saccharothrix variisporea]|uniref:Lysine decarboxylase transcriptional regulator CadC n=1 Tax=Saccharothrix variisporea TaxID=543527 RepID=A0A495XLG9_9PSEU|nr:lysine decarboxylase transcriptional regulator CadC [Saccharothrix variisporea]